MKSTYVKAERNITDYPCLGVGTNTGVIVLFSSPEIGTVVRDSDVYGLGHHSTEWDMDAFKKLSGSVTLEN